MANLIFLPLLVPLGAAIVSLLLWRQVNLQRLVALASCGLHLLIVLVLLNSVISSGMLVAQTGNWPAPYGLTLVADRLSAVMVLLGSILGFGIVVYSMVSMDSRREAFGYYPLLHLLLMGVSGAFLAGDVFNLYVWFEVTLISSFVLLALGGERPQLEGAIKYVTINLVSSAIFLAAVGCIYGISGTLNMADLSVFIGELSDDAIVTVVAMLFLVSFGIKAAVFPLFFWLPASYHTPPVAVSALLAGLLTKVGVYALIRFFTLIFHHDIGFTHTLILWIAVFTMVTGVLGAAAQWDFRRTLSFHIVSQIGYMLFGLALFTPIALAGAVFFIIHNMIAKTNLFLISGVVYRLRGSYEYSKLGGVYRAHPGLSLLFLISALALAGLPPLSGFWGKFILLKAGIQSEVYLPTMIALLVGLLTLFSMTKIWAEVFWKDAPEGSSADPVPHRQAVFLLSPIVFFAAGLIGMGVFAESIFSYMYATGEQLLNPQEYVETVLSLRGKT